MYMSTYLRCSSLFPNHMYILLSGGESSDAVVRLYSIDHVQTL